MFAGLAGSWKVAGDALHSPIKRTKYWLFDRACLGDVATNTRRSRLAVTASNPEPAVTLRRRHRPSLNTALHSPPQILLHVSHRVCTGVQLLLGRPYHILLEIVF